MLHLLAASRREIPDLAAFKNAFKKLPMGAVKHHLGFTASPCLPRLPSLVCSMSYTKERRDVFEAVEGGSRAFGADPEAGGRRSAPCTAATPWRSHSMTA